MDLRNCDCMRLMDDLGDKSQHLIIADPPYFEIKGEFDFIWESFGAYLKDVEKWAIGIKRILADNGTLFWWGYSLKIAYVQIILDKYFHLENSLIWQKIDSMQIQYYSPESARTFNSHNERLLMYSNDYSPGDWNKTGGERVFEEKIKPRHPFAIYLRSEFEKAKLSQKEIAKLFPSRTGGLTGCVSNWLNGDNTPTQEQYLKIREYVNGKFLKKEYDFLKKEYDELKNQYEDLRIEYENQRRFFHNEMKFEEVLRFPQEANETSKWSHPTQKPPKLCRALIRTASKKGQNLFIPFLGSGAEAVEGLNHGLNVTGSELDPEHFKTVLKRINEETIQASLF